LECFSAHLSIATYNVTKEPFGMNHRNPTIISLLSSLNADIIVLQEVTFDLLRRIRLESWVQQFYHISDITGRFFERDGSGHLILSKFPFESIKVMQLRSKDSRNAVICTFMVNQRKVGLAGFQVSFPFLSFPFLSFPSSWQLFLFFFLPFSSSKEVSTETRSGKLTFFFFLTTILFFNIQPMSTNYFPEKTS